MERSAKDQTRIAIERMEAEREARRRAIRDRKIEKAEEEQRNIAAGNPGDVDFIGLVRKWRKENKPMAQPLEQQSQNLKICICVRKRPVNEKELKRRDHDSVTCLHPSAWVHSPKLRVDGISKYLDHNSFAFDYTFDETSTTEDVYKYSTMPLMNFVCSGKGGRATVFAYGQTGSGKTHTMSGIQAMVAEDLFLMLSDEDETVSVRSEGSCTLENTYVTVSFFELYGGRVQDLLNNRHRLKILEDGKGEVVVSGLEDYEANNPQELLDLLEKGNRNRTTFATEANDTSSRSHALCQILLKDKSTSKLRGKLSLVDLAGSERGSDTKSHNRQRRIESAGINKSLLALKECIRALDSGGAGNNIHIPYRGSKLTQILKDCFTHNLARTTMIATVSPGSSSTDHTINTLRYTNRIKEKKVEDISSPSNVTHVTHAASNQETVKSGTKFKSKSPPSLVSPREDGRFTPTPEDENNLQPFPLRTKAQTSVSKIKGKSEMDKLQSTLQAILDEEELLLNLHMSVIQENVELLTEEGQLLQSVQGDTVVDYDIDKYAARLGCILDRKSHLISALQERLSVFKGHLRKEEELAKHMEEYEYTDDY